MATNIEIIGIKEIQSIYGLSQKEAYRMVDTKGCPVLPRLPGGKYRVIKDEFEKWLRSRRR